MVQAAKKSAGKPKVARKPKAPSKAKPTPPYQTISREEQLRLYQLYGGNHPLGLVNSISKSLRLKQQPSFNAAFNVHAREHGVKRLDWGMVKSLIGAVLSHRKRFPVTPPKKESFYDFQGVVVRMKGDKSGERRYEVQEKFGARICFARTRTDEPVLVSSIGNPSKHLISAASMFTYDRWIVPQLLQEKKDAEELKSLRPSVSELYAEHAEGVNRYWPPGEAPTQEELDR